MSKFALIGVGYIASKHLQAIKDVGGELVAATDPKDSVGILDKYAPETLFFRDQTKFFNYITDNPVDYISVCSPSYLHFPHIIAGLRAGANVICEKPLVINPSNFYKIRSAELESGMTVYPILQLRYHPVIQQLVSEIDLNKLAILNIDYNTYRGDWYDKSWKVDNTKSGGLAVNLGIHLFDILCHVFGEIDDYAVTTKATYNNIERAIGGHISFKCGLIAKFRLETRIQTVDRRIYYNGKTYDINFEGGNLHTECYKHILKGERIDLDEVHKSLELALNIGAQ